MSVNERQARALARRHPDATRAGWLLACDAPDNIAKGKRLFTRLNALGQTIARNYETYCRGVYAGQRY